jgi:hypothetical protein
MVSTLCDTHEWAQRDEPCPYCREVGSVAPRRAWFEIGVGNDGTLIAECQHCGHDKHTDSWSQLRADLQTHADSHRL